MAKLFTWHDEQMTLQYSPQNHSFSIEAHSDEKANMLRKQFKDFDYKPMEISQRKFSFSEAQLREVVGFMLEQELISNTTFGKIADAVKDRGSYTSPEYFPAV